ncbi:hypothetical protein DX914_14515 [Lysobacter silvisoli]|uniref:Uncharacterized protein n=2 Tax=Lysobacter silvisoli TaxID=2293254 RepID=A0A371K0R8_9GAMM|nr:hypothetical protein DX914_14515 [Lysobacter silvisoli]
MLITPPAPPFRRWGLRCAPSANDDGAEPGTDALRTLASRLLAYQAAALLQGRRSEAARLGQLLIDTADLKRALAASGAVASRGHDTQAAPAPELNAPR